jgi:hypothetical protein
MAVKEVVTKALHSVLGLSQIEEDTVEIQVENLTEAIQ